MPARCIGYARVSTTMQVADGVSLETQTERIRAYATFKNLPVVMFCDEGISGKEANNRPQLQLALAELRQGDVFAVYDLSRFARNTEDSVHMLKQIKKLGAEFVCTQLDLDTSTPAGKMIFGILSVFNDYERDMISTKVSDNMQRLSQEGKLKKKPPFGMKSPGKRLPFEPHPEQQAVIEMTKEWIKENDQLTVSEVVVKLNDSTQARSAQGGRPYHYAPVRRWMTANNITFKVERQRSKNHVVPN